MNGIGRVAHRNKNVGRIVVVCAILLTQQLSGGMANAQTPAPTSSSTSASDISAAAKDTSTVIDVSSDTKAISPKSDVPTITPPANLDEVTKKGLAELNAAIASANKPFSDTAPVLALPKLEPPNLTPAPKGEGPGEGLPMPPFESPPAPEGEKVTLPEFVAPPEQTIITETDTVLTPVTALMAIDRRTVNGKTLKAVLSLAAMTDAAGLTIQVALPKGLDYQDKSAAKADYDPASRTLTWKGVSASPKTIEQVDAFVVVVKTEAAPTLLALVTTVSGDAIKELLTFDTPVSVGVAQQGTARAKEGDGTVKEWQATSRATLDFAKDEPAASAPLTTI